ncbi:MAG: helix-turn-helix domain-containing protein [Syntrophobacteraceae bacterium]|jgi:hypothetical protein
MADRIMDELFNVKDVAKLFKCSQAYVYKLSDTGLLASIRIPCAGLGTQKKELVRFRPEDVFDFVERHYRNGRL